MGEMPDEILLDIFARLDASDLGSAATACSAWHRVASDDHLWRHHARALGWPDHAPSCGWREAARRLAAGNVLVLYAGVHQSDPIGLAHVTCVVVRARRNLAQAEAAVGHAVGRATLSFSLSHPARLTFVAPGDRVHIAPCAAANHALTRPSLPDRRDGARDEMDGRDDEANRCRDDPWRAVSRDNKTDRLIPLAALPEVAWTDGTDANARQSGGGGVLWMSDSPDVGIVRHLSLGAWTWTVAHGGTPLGPRSQRLSRASRHMVSPVDENPNDPRSHRAQNGLAARAAMNRRHVDDPLAASNGTDARRDARRNGRWWSSACRDPTVRKDSRRAPPCASTMSDTSADHGFLFVVEQDVGRTGTWLDCGHGTLLVEGQAYEGAWRSGRRDGVGTHCYDDRADVVYVGEWRDGVRYGRGCYRVCRGNAGGSGYEGEWRRDAPHGRGRAWSPDGCVYEGAFVGGCRHGFGVLTQPDGTRTGALWRMGTVSQIEWQTPSQAPALLAMPTRTLANDARRPRIGH